MRRRDRTTSPRRQCARSPSGSLRVNPVMQARPSASARSTDANAFAGIGHRIRPRWHPRPNPGRSLVVRAMPRRRAISSIAILHSSCPDVRPQLHACSILGTMRTRPARTNEADHAPSLAPVPSAAVTASTVKSSSTSAYNRSRFAIEVPVERAFAQPRLATDVLDPQLAKALPLETTPRRIDESLLATRALGFGNSGHQLRIYEPAGRFL